MVVVLARKYKYFFPYLDIDDLISEGICGLYEAEKKFNPKESKFGSYARFWVKKYMQKFITESFTMLKVPSKILSNLKNILNYISKNEGKKVSLEEISRELNIDLDKIKELLVNQLKSKKTLSLDSYFEEDGEENLYNIFADKDEVPSEKFLQMQENIDYLKYLLSNLTEEEVKVLKLKYGIFGEKKHSFAEISKKMNLRVQQVRNILTQLLLKLKKINREKEYE